MQQRELPRLLLAGTGMPRGCGEAMKDYYAIMGLTRNAPHSVVRTRYRNLAKTLHPDVGGNAQQFAELQEAYEVLGDPVKRRAYDLQSNVREFVAPDSGSVDLIGLFQGIARGRVPDQFVKQVSPVLERKLEEHGVNARATTAEDVLTAIGWLEPKAKRRKRAS
jgi:DnaJ-class molecular chaperone